MDEEIGDDRAVWLHVLLEREAWLVCGVYGFHPGYPEVVRRSFWEKRFDEARRLAANPRFHGCKLTIMGDFNIHLAEVCDANLRYQGSLDIWVAENLRRCCGQELDIANPMGQSTHRSGTAIDMA